MKLELNKIYNMDCIEGMKLIPDNHIDLILTDIPYDSINRESNGLRSFNKKDADIIKFDLDLFVKECMRICKGSIYIFCGHTQISQILNIFNYNGFSTRLIIWEKSNPSPINGEYIWLSGIESCVYAKKKNATFNAFCKNSVLRFQSKKMDFNELIKHPTVKPIKLFRELINISSNENDLILDPCIGSGTTAVASKELNRNFIGFEISEEYCQIANKRLEQCNLTKWFEEK